MIKVSSTEIRPYFCKVTLTTTSGDQEIYTDTPSQYEIMVNNFNHILNCKTEGVQLSDEETKRLTALQTLVGQLEEKSEPAACNFVKYGYISPFDDCDGGVCTMQPMLKLLETWEYESKQALISKYKEILASTRYDLECGGVEFNGMTAYSDKQSQASISSTVQLFQVGGLESTKFKFMDGWQILTFDQMKLLALTVASHVQICFNAEELTSTKLNTMSLKELASFKENPFESKQNNEASVVTLYKETVNTLKAQLAASK